MLPALFADAVMIQVSGADLLAAAGTLSVGLAGGLTSGARVLAWYFALRDKGTDDARAKADAVTARRNARAFKRLGAALEKITATQLGLARRLDEIDERTAEHRTVPTPPSP